MSNRKKNRKHNILFEEFRLIERCENEVNGAWKGAHLLLFFLAFIFGSFCTFCFHMLMYLFEEKCVLFPKLLSLTSLRHNVIYEFIPEDKDKDMLPVDFVSTQWVEKSACYLPTYVPLVSGIFGLIWTTMFLMCTTGSRTLTGLQRPWRVIPPVFLFSLAMGGLCIYSSTVTHFGLNDLCSKLGELTDSHSCSYTVNVATLLYERKIRGVYQATRLTIISAWLHTICWLLSALLALIRILLVVDFRLVKVNVELVGDIDKMLERNEEQLRTVSPKFMDDKIVQNVSSDVFTEVHFENDGYESGTPLHEVSSSNLLFLSTRNPMMSSVSLVPDEEHKLIRLRQYAPLPKDEQFIVKIVYDIIDSIVPTDSSEKSSLSIVEVSETPIIRQYGQQYVYNKSPDDNPSATDVSSYADDDATDVKEKKRTKRKRPLIELTPRSEDSSPRSSSSPKKRGRIAFESVMNIAPETRQTLSSKIAARLERLTMPKNEAPNPLEEPSQAHENTLEPQDEDESSEAQIKALQNEVSSHKASTSKTKKSNLKNIAVQTDKKSGGQDGKQKVKISESRSTFIAHEREPSIDQEEQPERNEESQTAPKEKQD